MSQKRGAQYFRKLNWEYRSEAAWRHNLGLPAVGYGGCRTGPWRKLQRGGENTTRMLENNNKSPTPNPKPTINLAPLSDTLRLP